MTKTISLVTILALSTAVEVANADYIFGTPTNLGPVVNSSAEDSTPSISPDGLSLYFGSKRSGGHGTHDLYIVTRETTDDEWGAPMNLGPTINSSSKDWAPSISADGLTLYFSSNRSGGHGKSDLWIVTRETTDDEWGAPMNLGPTINSSSHDWSPSISADGLELFMHSDRPSSYGGDELWVATRKTTSDEWGSPANLGPTVNSRSLDATPSISADGLMLFFQSNRPGGYGGIVDIWVTMRSTTNADWGTPVNLGPTINTADFDGNPCISADGSTLYFVANRSAGSINPDIYQVSIDLLVDLNGDGIVDSADMCIMVDHWGENYSLCDIGPMPWGDGIVDVQDLIVLAEHLFEEISDPTLVAHWALDETDGMFVTDSAGNKNGYALGDALWRPDGGQVNGALEFDGVDDFISAPIPLNPADPEISSGFSVFVWVKGGAAAQAIISETGGPDWLSLDPLTGHLMTELTSGGRDGSSLLAETTITDGNWHRIGLVWDGFYRTLYVDSVAVAEDTQDDLQSPGSGLYIGCGDPMQPSTFFSGLIDDVRVYKRAVKP